MTAIVLGNEGREAGSYSENTGMFTPKPDPFLFFNKRGHTALNLIHFEDEVRFLFEMRSLIR
jgi:hypothetical protein